jgi:hypothetical protein
LKSNFRRFFKEIEPVSKGFSFERHLGLEKQCSNEQKLEVEKMIGNVI